MRFTRKNLFLTLLNNDGNVLCKTNIGSCGFKKKVKFTGYAIKRTSKRFSKKILGSFIKNIYFVRENCKKKMYKIKELIFLNNKNINIFNKRINIFNSKKILINKKRKKINNKKRNKYKFIKIKKKHKKKIYNKKVLRAIIKKKKILKNFNKYRNYPYLVESIRKAFNIKIRVKSNFKF
jgi:glutamate synthase domain-containing protein 2